MSRSFYLNNIQMYIRNLESKQSLFTEMKLNTDNGFCVSGKKRLNMLVTSKQKFPFEVLGHVVFYC